MASPYSHVNTARVHLVKLIEELYEDSSIHVDPEVFSNVAHALKLLDRCLAQIRGDQTDPTGPESAPTPEGPAQT